MNENELDHRLKQAANGSLDSRKDETVINQPSSYLEASPHYRVTVTVAPEFSVRVEPKP